MNLKWMKASLVSTGLTAVAVCSASDLKVGGHVEPFALQDQRGEAHRIDEHARLLLFSRDKGLAKMAFSVLDQKGPAYLADRHAYIILDISSMPGLITWAVAKPRMRRHAFPLLLDAGPGPTEALPTRDKQLTLIYLNGLNVERIVYLSDVAVLEKALQFL